MRKYNKGERVRLNPSWAGIGGPRYPDEVYTVVGWEENRFLGLLYRAVCSDGERRLWENEMIPYVEVESLIDLYYGSKT